MWDGAGARSVWARVRRVTRWCGARAERTANMAAMVVTLDVSKLSGWLNASACCRVVRGGHTRQATRRLGGACEWAGGGARSEAGERRKGDQRVRGTGRARLKHARHGGDAGRVETQRLVERSRILRCGGGLEGW